MADLLAHLAEVDSRRLFVPAGYPTMFAYCVGKLGFSEDVAFKRIRSARVARKFPDALDAIADGKVHVAALVLLAPYLLSPSITREAGGGLLAAATHKTKRQVEELLAARFPVMDKPTRVRAIVARASVVTTSPPTPSEAAEVVPPSWVEGRRCGRATGPGASGSPDRNGPGRKRGATFAADT